MFLCCFNALQLRPMYENLLAVNPAGEFVPGLATSWTLEPDGQSMRIELREGVEFHNGNGEFTADDAINFFDEFVTFDDAHVFSASSGGPSRNPSRRWTTTRSSSA